MSGDQIVSRCKPYVMNGAGDYACQLPNVETGEYRFDVAINTVSIAKLNFGVGQTTNVRPPDAGPLPGDKPKEEEKPAEEAEQAPAPVEKAPEPKAAPAPNAPTSPPPEEDRVGDLIDGLTPPPEQPPY